MFYQGKEIGIVYLAGMRAGTPSCGPDIQCAPSLTVAETVPQRAEWARINCSFPSIVAAPVGSAPDLHALSANKGEYELKVIRKNKLARSVKFTIGSDGKFVDDGIVGANNMGASAFIIVPVTILDDQDGPWDRTAWKTDAFYGNPLKGFTVP